MTGAPTLATAKEQWDRLGWCVLAHLVPPDVLSAAQRALGQLFPTAEEFATDQDPARNAPFRTADHAVLHRFPFESPALNQLVLHDVLLDLAEQFLGTPDIRLYQGLASAKYANGAPDDEQLLHADYGNHTLVVPRHDTGYEQLELFVYLSDVTPETAATRLVPLDRTAGIPVERTYLRFDEYADLYAGEVAACGPAGSVLAYRPDVYHRGVTLTETGGARFILHVAYKAAATDWLGFQAWPSRAEDMAWHRLMTAASVRQLRALGFPAPGDPYWPEATLAGVGARYPSLDMAPWRSTAPG